VSPAESANKDHEMLWTDEKVNRVNEAPGHVLSWQLSGQPGSRDRRGSEGVPMRIT